MIRAGVLGAAGYLGGELLRLLIGHPKVMVGRAVSTRFPGRRVDGVHPNLRGWTDLCFSSMSEAGDFGDCDVVLLATPHGTAMDLLPAIEAPLIIDLSGDFRLRDPEAYERYYGTAHTAAERLADVVPGLPELFRPALREANLISVPGCMATAAILALAPLADLIEPAVQIDARTGSSGSGASTRAGNADLHAERSGALRVYAPTGHRHEAEVAQVTGLHARMTATGVQAVRGVQVLCHATVRHDAVHHDAVHHDAVHHDAVHHDAVHHDAVHHDAVHHDAVRRDAGPLDEKAVRRAYRARYGDEPFVRIVAHRHGPHRLPDPKILLGSNHCDVGFAVDGDRVTLIAALDNLMKGGSGNAVQCLNVRMGWPERLGLDFPGLHPI